MMLLELLTPIMVLKVQALMVLKVQAPSDGAEGTGTNNGAASKGIDDTGGTGTK